MSQRRRKAPTSPFAAAGEILDGRVRKIVWQDTEDDGPVICRLVGDQAVKTATGAARVKEGDWLRFLGQWVEDPKYGRQFNADCWFPGHSGDRAGAVAYLASTCKGVGKVRARLLVDAHGTDAVRILRETPERCVGGQLLSEDVAQAASAVLAARAQTERVTIELHGLLAGRGFGSRAIRAAILTWGQAAAMVIEGCPWRLLLDSIPGAGWQRVDTLYTDLGYDRAALLRQAVAGWFAVRGVATGSTWHPEGLFRCGVHAQTSPESARLDEALALAVRARWVERSRPELAAALIADPRDAAAERGAALYLARLMQAGPGAWPLPLPPHVSEHQANAVATAARGRVMLLTGTPGTGKTFVAAALLRLVAASNGVGAICVMAPTGKAAVRITAALRANHLDIEATTIHRGLGVRKAGYDGDGWSFWCSESNPLPYQWIAVDEVSMLDTDLASALFRSIRPGTHVLLVGDPYQLPPVGHGSPLRDLLAAGLPAAELTEIKRNSGLITTGCRAIKGGRAPAVCARLNVEAGDNLRLIACRTDHEQRDAISQVLRGLRDRPGTDPIWDVAILTPTNDSSAVARKPLNDYLRELLNPARETDPKAGQDSWRLRDKVICLQNGFYDAVAFDPGLPIHLVSSWHDADQDGDADGRYFAANGELGRVIAIDPVKPDVVLRFDAPTRYILVAAPKRVQHDDGTDSAREDGFALCYAMTGHKSQGSEWTWVIVVLDPAGDRVSSREWLYTAISRASRACILVGTEDTLRRQLRRAELPGRKTLLRELILEALVAK